MFMIVNKTDICSFVIYSSKNYFYDRMYSAVIHELDMLNKIDQSLQISLHLRKRRWANDYLILHCNTLQSIRGNIKKYIYMY